MKKSRKLAPSKYLRKYGKAKISRPMITKEEVEAVLECEITDERYEELLEASRLYSLSNSDKHVNLAQDAEHNRDWEGAKKHWKNAALASIKHDTVHKTQRSDKLKVRGITMRKEEVEQIAELSNKTLKSYIKKGSRDMKRTKRNMDDSDGPDDAGESNGDYGKLQRRFSKRWKGFNTAIRSKGTAVKEAVEQIDELKKSTLASYVKKAHVDAVDTGYAQGLRRPTSSQEDDDWVSDKNNFRMDKRERGIKNAVKKLAKEAVELSTSRKTKVNALLAKHQAKGLPAKPSKKYTREYTGDGLPLIAAVINQEETLNETKE